MSDKDDEEKSLLNVTYLASYIDRRNAGNRVSIDKLYRILYMPNYVNNRNKGVNFSAFTVLGAPAPKSFNEVDFHTRAIAQEDSDNGDPLRSIRSFVRELALRADIYDQNGEVVSQVDTATADLEHLFG